MKKILIFIAVAVLGIASCKKPEPVVTGTVEVTLKCDDAVLAQAGVSVQLVGEEVVLDATTDEAGVAKFEKVLPGLWIAAVHTRIQDGDVLNVYSGEDGPITVVIGETSKFELAIEKVVTSPLIIKELYVGGCMDNDGAKNYSNDKYITLYNNSGVEVDASDVCIAMSGPISASGANKYVTDGVYSFEAEGWMPAFYSIWWFQGTVKIAPYSQIVVAITGAIDHTATYTNSVDLSSADYCFYDPESGFNNASSYPAPSASIPADHYMKTYRYGAGNAWPIHMSQPSIFLCRLNNVEARVKDAENYDHTCGTSAASNAVKVPFNRILDCIEGWDAANVDKSTNRFPASLNSGYVVCESKKGYTFYRNVDAYATTALEENAGKIVLGYTGGTDVLEPTYGTTDLSGIDAEASIAQGAKIIYSNFNNTTADFHLRAVSSLKK